jgi:dihydroorotase
MPMFDLVVRGGTIVTGGGQSTGTVAIHNGVIQDIITDDTACSAREDIDASGKFILPGLVDAHVHIPGYALAGRLDNFATATAAAALGGVTTVMLMPTDDPRTATASYFIRKRKLGDAQSRVDFAIQAMVGPKTERSDIVEMAEQGAISFEVFLAYGGNPSFIIGHDDYELHRLMGLVCEVGGVLGVTPHSASLIAHLTEREKLIEVARKHLNNLDPEPTRPPVQVFSLTRPTVSEGLGLARACVIAAETKTKIHLRSLSAKSSISIVNRFRDDCALSSEVMSHHLIFTDEDAYRFGPYGVIVPPIRSAAERAALREAIRDSAIDMVVSDHSPALREDKELGWADIWRTPPGMPGLQTLLPSMLALVDEGIFALSDVVRSCAERPAECFGISPKKGSLKAGTDADFIIIDPKRSTIIDDTSQKSRANYTTLKGREIKSRIERVYLRGNLIAHEGELVGVPQGRFVCPKKPAL